MINHLTGEIIQVSRSNGKYVAIVEPDEPNSKRRRVKVSEEIYSAFRRKVQKNNPNVTGCTNRMFYGYGHYEIRRDIITQ